MGTQKNRLSETILLSTHYIEFALMIREKRTKYPSLSGPLLIKNVWLKQISNFIRSYRQILHCDCKFEILWFWKLELIITGYRKHSTNIDNNTNLNSLVMFVKMININMCIHCSYNKTLWKYLKFWSCLYSYSIHHPNRHYIHLSLSSNCSELNQ